jgi:hypothetical protein
MYFEPGGVSFLGHQQWPASANRAQHVIPDRLTHSEMRFPRFAQLAIRAMLAKVRSFGDIEGPPTMPKRNLGNDHSVREDGPNIMDAGADQSPPELGSKWRVPFSRCSRAQALNSLCSNEGA